MRTQLTRVAAVLAVTITVSALNAAGATPQHTNITMWWCRNHDIERDCMCMFDNDSREIRRICPEDGGCWHDEGWQPWGGESVLPSDGNALLPTYYDGDHNLYIMVGPNKGGVFSGSGIGTCLPFTSNTTGAIMLPARLLQ